MCEELEITWRARPWKKKTQTALEEQNKQGDSDSSSCNFQMSNFNLFPKNTPYSGYVLLNPSWKLFSILGPFILKKKCQQIYFKILLD